MPCYAASHLSLPLIAAYEPARLPFLAPLRSAAAAAWSRSHARPCHARWL